jgi:hypothetical protein
MQMYRCINGPSCARQLPEWQIRIRHAHLLPDRSPGPPPERQGSTNASVEVQTRVAPADCASQKKTGNPRALHPDLGSPSLRGDCSRRVSARKRNRQPVLFEPTALRGRVIPADRPVAPHQQIRRRSSGRRRQPRASRFDDRRPGGGLTMENPTETIRPPVLLTPPFLRGSTQRAPQQPTLARSSAGS